MKFFNLRKHVIEIIALAYIAYFAVHSARFFMNNGLCSGWGTGIIHGNESAGAAALPPVSGFPNYVSLDFLRPVTSPENMLTLLSLVIITSILMIHLMRIVLRKQSYSIRTTMLLFAVVAPVVASDFERYTDCNLSHTHLNIQRTFALLHSDDTDETTVRYKQMLKTYNVYLVRLSDNTHPDIFELFGHYGEATCRAYVVAFARADPIAPRERYPHWITLNHMAHDNSEVVAVLEKINSSWNTTVQVYFSVKQFSSYQQAPDNSAVKHQFSIIACTAWPYGWMYEMALTEGEFGRDEARLPQEQPKRMSSHG